MSVRTRPKTIVSEILLHYGIRNNDRPVENKPYFGIFKDGVVSVVFKNGIPEVSFLNGSPKIYKDRSVREVYGK